jgi:hypothetical protein
VTERGNYSAGSNSNLTKTHLPSSSITNAFLGVAMAQAVSRRPLTAEVQVRSRDQSMWDLWWAKWHWDRVFPEYFGFLCQFHSTGAQLL